MRSRPLVAAPPARRAGLAFPTVLAALVCGGSVLAIAVSGSVALDGGDAMIALPPPLSGETAARASSSTPVGVARGGSAPAHQAGAGQWASAIPPTVPRHAARPAPAPVGSIAGAVPAAATAIEHAVQVRGGGFDGSPVPPADRGPLTAPRVIAAAAPTIIVLDPTPVPSQPTETQSPPPTPTPSPPSPSPSPTGSAPGSQVTASGAAPPPSAGGSPSAVGAPARPAVVPVAAPARRGAPARHHGHRHNQRRSRHGHGRPDSCSDRS